MIRVQEEIGPAVERGDVADDPEVVVSCRRRLLIVGLSGIIPVWLFRCGGWRRWRVSPKELVLKLPVMRSSENPGCVWCKGMIH